MDALCALRCCARAEGELLVRHAGDLVADYVQHPHHPNLRPLACLVGSIANIAVNVRGVRGFPLLKVEAWHHIVLSAEAQRTHPATLVRKCRHASSLLQEALRAANQLQPGSPGQRSQPLREGRVQGGASLAQRHVARAFKTMDLPLSQLAFHVAHPPFVISVAVQLEDGRRLAVLLLEPHCCLRNSRAAQPTGAAAAREALLRVRPLSGSGAGGGPGPRCAAPPAAGLWLARGGAGHDHLPVAPQQSAGR